MGWILALVMAVACESPGKKDVPPGVDEAAVTDWARRAVMAALLEAERAEVQAGRELVTTRRNLLASYFGATRATVEAFRTNVPRTDPELSYDLGQTRRALEAADAAQDALLSEAPSLALALGEMLELGTFYLDAMEGAVGAAESGEPSLDTAGFLARYSSLVEAYDVWAERAGADVERLNADLEGTLSRDSRRVRGHAGRALLMGGWPRALGEACRAATGTDSASRLVLSRRLDLYRTFAQLLSETATPLSNDCRAAARPMLDAYLQCHQQVLAGSADGSARPSEADAPGQLETEVSRFEAVREAVCGGTP